MEERAHRETVAGVVYALPRFESREIAPMLAASRPLRFVDASELEMIVLVERRSWVAEVFGVSVGVGAVQGRVLTLLRVGAGSEGPALLCRAESGEPFLLEGGSIEEVGRFPSETDGCVTRNGDLIARLDLTALYRWLEKHLWERRWITREQLETKAPH